ncbi:MAG: hypothetical protein V3U54_12320, partial [Thermodesulfobacteriota bacterium]
PNDWSIPVPVADASNMLNLPSPVLSLVRIKRLSVLEADSMVAVTPVALEPELALFIFTAISDNVSVVVIFIALPFMTNSPERFSAVEALV